MTVNIVIKHFQQSDLKTVHALVQETIDISYGAVYPPEAIKAFKRYHSTPQISEDSQKGLNLLAVVNHEIAGTGTLLENKVIRFFVLPRYQGYGIGKKLAVAIEARAQQLGIDFLYLSSSLIAREFWELMGFVYQETISVPLDAGQTLDYHRMTKRLCAGNKQ